MKLKNLVNEDIYDGYRIVKSPLTSLLYQQYNKMSHTLYLTLSAMAKKQLKGNLVAFDTFVNGSYVNISGGVIDCRVEREAFDDDPAALVLNLKNVIYTHFDPLSQRQAAPTFRDGWYKVSAGLSILKPKR